MAEGDLLLHGFLGGLLVCLPKKEIKDIAKTFTNKNPLPNSSVWKKGINYLKLLQRTKEGNSLHKILHSETIIISGQNKILRSSCGTEPTLKFEAKQHEFHIIQQTDRWWGPLVREKNREISVNWKSKQSTSQRALRIKIRVGTEVGYPALPPRFFQWCPLERKHWFFPILIGLKLLFSITFPWFVRIAVIIVGVNF